MEQSGLPLLVLGFLLGMKHALDVDHLAAVATLVAGRRGRWKSAAVGAWWGLGHSASLMLLGGFIIAFDLRFPPEVSLLLEFGIGLMLIVLGLRVLLRLRKGATLHLHAHEHEGRRHIHPHTHLDIRPDGQTAAARRPHPEAAGHHGVPGTESAPAKTSLVVGMLHGLAGSAGLTLVLLPSMPTRLMSIVYLALFGAGSVLGMSLATFLVSFPLKMLGGLGHGGAGARIVTILAGGLSLFVGLTLMLETGGVLLQF